MNNINGNSVLPEGVSYRAAAPHPQFPDEVTMMIRFARYKSSTRCAVCGKNRKLHWTMLVPFHGCITHQFVMDESKLLKALTPVCRDHPMVPEFMRLIGAMEEKEAP